MAKTILIIVGIIIVIIALMSAVGVTNLDKLKQAEQQNKLRNQP